MNELKTHTEVAQKVIGLTGALIQGGLLAFELDDPGPLRFGPIYIAIALIFLASIRLVFLAYAQAPLFFILAALQTASSHNCLYGLSFASFGVLILFRRGYFFEKAINRAFVLASGGSALLILPVIAWKSAPLSLVSHL